MVISRGETPTRGQFWYLLFSEQWAYCFTTMDLLFYCSIVLLLSNNGLLFPLLLYHICLSRIVFTILTILTSLPYCYHNSNNSHVSPALFKNLTIATVLPIFIATLKVFTYFSSHSFSFFNDLNVNLQKPLVLFHTFIRIFFVSLNSSPLMRA